MLANSPDGSFSAILFKIVVDLVSEPADLNALLRHLPKVDEVLRQDVARRLLEWAPRWAVVSAVREEIELLRSQLIAAPLAVPQMGGISPRALEGRVEELLRPSLVRVLNGTGVVLHTNLGRAPLALAAVERVAEVARGYCNLEYRLDEESSERRGSRHEHVASLITLLTGAETALVVNNNAAAVLLSLATLAAGREVIVSRGELVEIGGSFRVPDVMRASGAKLVEVGTTNRTHLADYERAIGPETALLLKVHQSNFAQIGFTADVSIEDLVALGRAHQLPTMVDLGSGSLVAPSTFGLEDEPTVAELVHSGADVVTCSGDKLLGGPQAGLLLARKGCFAQLRGHPLLRAMRPDKLALAALEATLELYRDGRDGRVATMVPTLAMLSAAPELLRSRAERLAALVREHAGVLDITLVEVNSAVGGGALPRSEPRSVALAVAHPHLGPEAIDKVLRHCAPPLVARIADGRILVDVRTLADHELREVAAAFARVARTAEAKEQP